MVKEGLSLVDIATTVLQDIKEPINLYDLFDEVLKRKELEVEDKAELLALFYADLTISAKFVYTGENKWDLKSNQKIELWEKDGSYFKEYNEIDLPEEYLEKPKPKAAPKTVVVEETPVVEAVEETPVVEAVEEAPVVEETPTIDPAVQQYEEQAAEEFEEDLFEDDFDEDKYNEYMDTYEDQYDD